MPTDEQDWTCRCGNVNSPHAITCLKCKSERPVDITQEQLDVLSVCNAIDDEKQTPRQFLRNGPGWLVMFYREARRPLLEMLGQKGAP